MSRRAFRLAALLRLRRLQQDQAAADLALAAAARLAASERADAARRDFATHRTPSTCSSQAWTASVAARAALSAASKQAAVALDEAAWHADLATDAWRAARRDTTALERLEEKHDARVARELLREEQLRLDEHTSATSHRRDGATS